MKNVIKFDRPFTKLKLVGLSERYVESAILLDVHCDISPSETFLKYDTFADEREEPYSIDPNKEYILLIFIEANYNTHTFLTLRKDTKENRLKYMRKIGEVFKVEIQR